MKVIGISGKKGSGKNYIAEVIKELAYLKGKSTREISFADKLKDMCSLLINLNIDYFYDQYSKEHMIVNLKTLVSKIHSDEQLISTHKIHLVMHDDQYKDCWITIRSLLQYFGTNVMQNSFGKLIWITSIIKSIENFNSDYLIIPDVRFEHEAEAIKKIGGIIIRVDNKYTDDKDSHYSENALNSYNFDFKIINDYKNGVDNESYVYDQVTELFNIL